MAFSIYDILSFNEDGENNSPQEGSVSTQDAMDDDFSIDTSLDDGGSDNSEEVGPPPDDNGGGMETPGSMEGAEGDPNALSDEEANEDNTDIFASLSAEEQQIKIKELKKLYSNLYSSCDELLNRINDLDIDENNLDSITRISTSLYDLKNYIADYIVYNFPQKSYIENDIAFNRFLLIINSISDILKKFIQKEED